MSPFPRRLRLLAAELADALFPPACPLCPALDGEDGLGCARHRLEPGLAGPRCGRCAGALPPALPDGLRCAACRARAPAFDGVLAAYAYEGEAAVREWLLAFKHGGRAELAETLGRALAAHALATGALGARGASRIEPGIGPAIEPAIAPHPPPRALLVPVPLHPVRRFERGYDQALLLARVVARVTGTPLARALSRARATEVQGAPGARSRSANVAGAFRARRGARAAVEGAEVWLVDDVVTSGATASECARVLRSLGARRVRVLAIARA